MPLLCAAQAYPARPVRLIIPAGAGVGGVTDLLAPTGTPKAIVARLHAEVAKILSVPEMKERFLTPIGGDPVGGTPEQFAADIKADIARWGKIVR